LLDWLRARAGGTPRVLLNHGEQSSREALAARIHHDLGLSVESPTPLLPTRV
jgi:predicted metal-dependent RNase